MRKISSAEITDKVKALIADTSFNLPEDVLLSLKDAKAKETGIAKDVIEDILKNSEIAAKEQIPLCQDTGTANFFIKLGKDVEITGSTIYDAINTAVSQSYTENYLRKSIVSDPLVRKNTKDNTPANIYLDIVSGDKIEITFLPKGGGSENASLLKMLEPSSDWHGVKETVLEAIKLKGSNACPPLVIGVGIGGDFASVGKIAKKSLLREIGSKNESSFYEQKEKELLDEINKLNIGPMGMGGKTTALAVFIETAPTHIASLPVAINIQCHSCRRKKIVI